MDSLPCLRAWAKRAPARHEKCLQLFRMFPILCIIGAIWLFCSAVFVFALVAAARKPKPVRVEQSENIVFEEAA